MGMQHRLKETCGILLSALLIAACVSDDLDRDLGAKDDLAPGPVKSDGPQPGTDAIVADVVPAGDLEIAFDLEADAGSCGQQGQSCVDAPESCCAGLMCCGGVPVPQGKEFCGVTCPISDRNVKFNRRSVDARSVLKRLAQLPISEWTYANETSDVRHYGPMAQDFRAAFGLGADERFIATVDADGVALLAIQALSKEVAELRRELSVLKTSRCK